jgi:cytidylate kinase
MFKAVTIAREYGSGGADVGRRLAELIGWSCIDKEIIERVAAMGKVDPAWAKTLDERVLAWWKRILNSFRKGGPELFIGSNDELCVDHETMQNFTARVIQEAAKVGNCIIIGRSSGCLLRHDPNVLRVFVYAPLSEKLARMRLRHPQEQNLEALLDRIDSERIQYAQTYYGSDPRSRDIYHLCLNSTLGIDACAELVAHELHSLSEAAGPVPADA